MTREYTGLSSTPEYWAWRRMRHRCRNPRDARYEYYGARGISVCSRWDLFANFLEDMGPRPSPKHSLDRIDGNGNYEPENCRWGTTVQQSRNRRNV